MKKVLFVAALVAVAAGCSITGLVLIQDGSRAKAGGTGVIFDGRPVAAVGSSSFKPPWSGLSYCGSIGTNGSGCSLSAAYQIVSNAAFPGGKAHRIRVENGWKFGSSSGERTELNNAVFNSGGTDPGFRNGNTRWMGFSVSLAAGFPTITSHAEIFQYKSDDQGFPNITLHILNNDFILATRGGANHRGGMTSHTIVDNPARETRYDFKLQLRISDSNAGWERVWVKTGPSSTWILRVDTSDSPHANTYTGVSQTFYNFRAGLYTGDGETASRVLYSYGPVVATTEAAINAVYGGSSSPPPPPPEPPPPAPPPPSPPGPTLEERVTELEGRVQDLEERIVELEGVPVAPIVPDPASTDTP